MDLEYLLYERKKLNEQIDTQFDTQAYQSSGPERQRGRTPYVELTLYGNRGPIMRQISGSTHHHRLLPWPPAGCFQSEKNTVTDYLGTIGSTLSVRLCPTMRAVASNAKPLEFTDSHILPSMVVLDVARRCTSVTQRRNSGYLGR